MTVNYPNTLHDASLVSINLALNDRNVVQSIELKFLEEKINKPIHIFFRDVFEFQLGNLTFQNIVLDADVYSGCDEINKYFQKENIEIFRKGLESFDYEMTVFSSSVGMNGFVIYKTKEIIT